MGGLSTHKIAFLAKTNKKTGDAFFGTSRFSVSPFLSFTVFDYSSSSIGASL